MSNNQLQNDEFDVEVFTQKIYHIIIRGFKKLGFPFRVVFSKPISLGLFLALGVGLALLLKFSLPPTYKSSFILKPQNSGDLTFINLIYDISILVKENDKEALMYELHLDEKTINNLVKLDFDPIKRNRYIDTVHLLVIKIYTNDPSSFETVQNSIYNYLENSPYYSKMKNVHQKEMVQMERKLALDMFEIDSVKRVMAQNIQPRGNGGFVYGEPMDPVKIYEEGLNLFHQQMGINWQKQYSNNFELVKSCTATNKPFWPKLSILLLVCVSLSLVCCFIYQYRKL